MTFSEFLDLIRIISLGGLQMGKGKTIAGVTSQLYHRSFIIAVIALQFYHRSNLSFALVF